MSPLKLIQVLLGFGDAHEERRIKFAQRSATIYVPIAQKLGLYSIKGELEDLALRYLE